jgi:hypothetical protein
MVEHETYDESRPASDGSGCPGKLVSRVVLTAFLFALLCLVVPTVVGENKGIPSFRWYGGAVVLAGIAALVAGRVTRHRFAGSLPAPSTLETASTDAQDEDADRSPLNQDSILRAAPSPL